MALLIVEESKAIQSLDINKPINASNVPIENSSSSSSFKNKTVPSIATKRLSRDIWAFCKDTFTHNIGAYQAMAISPESPSKLTRSFMKDFNGRNETILSKRLKLVHPRQDDPNGHHVVKRRKRDDLNAFSSLTRSEIMKEGSIKSTNSNGSTSIPSKKCNKRKQQNPKKIDLRKIS